MSEATKQELLALMEETHATLLETVMSIDLEIVIHAESGWRGREMLSHIGAWDREVAKSLHGFLKGEEYLTPDYEEDHFNNQAAVAQQGMTIAEIVEDWKLARRELIEAVEKIPADNIHAEVLYPWGEEHGTIFDLVKYFCDHDIDHKEEMESIVKGSA